MGRPTRIPLCAHCGTYIDQKLSRMVIMDLSKRVRQPSRLAWHEPMCTNEDPVLRSENAQHIVDTVEKRGFGRVITIGKPRALH